MKTLRVRVFARRYVSLADMAQLGDFLDAIELEVNRGRNTQDSKFSPELAKAWLDWYTAEAVKADALTRRKDDYSPSLYSSVEVKLSPVEGRPSVLEGTLPVMPADYLPNKGIQGVFYINPYGEREPLVMQSPGEVRFSKAAFYTNPEYSRIGDVVEVYGLPFLEQVNVVYVGSPVLKEGQSYMDMEYPLPPDLAPMVLERVIKRLKGIEASQADVTNDQRVN